MLQRHPSGRSTSWADLRDLAVFYADIRASGIEHVTVSRVQGDGGAEDVFRVALDGLGIEVEVTRTRT